MSAVFRYTNPPVIHWGAGARAELGNELARLRVTRLALVTTRSLQANEQLMRLVTGVFGSADLVATAVIGQHAPIAEVDAAVEQSTAAGVDGVVSFGGGSPIDAAKIVAVKVADHKRPAARALPHIAIPTTLSVAELASGAGFTDPLSNKAGMRDPRMLPDVVFYDGELTLATPIELWLSTGIRALDHAVEGFMSEGLHPFSDVMALEAIRRLFRSLPQAKANPGDVHVRTDNQLAAWFGYTLPGPSAGGLSHVMGKQIGAHFGIPHGVTSCLLMPHVMRYLSEEQPARSLQLGQATGTGVGRLAAADDVQRLIASLGLPQHIASFGVTEADLRTAAAALAGRYPAADLLRIYLAAM